MMHFRRNEIKVGVFVLVPLLMLIIFTILKLGYSLAGSTMDVYLKIDTIKTIKVGTPIQVKGYTIGRVVKILPVYEPDLHFLALMRIENDIVIYENCSVIIQNQNIIGDAVIKLVNPEIKTGLLQTNDVLEGIEYVSLEALLEEVHTVLSSITRTADAVGDVARENNNNIKRVTENLAESSETLNSILSKSQGSVLETVTTLRKTSKKLEDITTELHKHPLKYITR